MNLHFNFPSSSAAVAAISLLIVNLPEIMDCVLLALSCSKATVDIYQPVLLLLLLLHSSTGACFPYQNKGGQQKNKI